MSRDTWFRRGAGWPLPTAALGYRKSWLRGDLLAGVTVAAYLVPQVMAYARVAGLSPATGLWAAVPALVIYAAMGSSRSLSLGPEATTALMTAIAVGPLAAGNPARYAGLAATLALLAGAMAVAAGLAQRRIAAEPDRAARDCQGFSGHDAGPRSGAYLPPRVPPQRAAVEMVPGHRSAFLSRRLSWPNVRAGLIILLTSCLD